MKLSRRFDYALILVAVVSLGSVFCAMSMQKAPNIYADGTEIYTEATSHFVTIYDQDVKLTVKTDAPTVEQALGRLNVQLNNTDRVEPSLDTTIDRDNFFINIYRSRPVIIDDSGTQKYLMTASFDPKVIASEAGVDIYDGDQIDFVPNVNFLEAGIANVYKITRNGGRTITIEEEIPFSEETVKDYRLASGSSEVRQLGEVGRKEVVYEVFYIDGVETERKLVSENITKEPISRIVAIGAKRSIAPEQETCANWARQAGVSEDDMSAALQLIYRESGCRVDAENASTGAYGIPQALPGTKMASAGSDWKTNPVTQIRWMVSYVSGRYGGWQGALNHSDTYGWY